MYRIFANPAETSISSYVEIIFQFALGIGIFLAVAAIVFGGIEYMTSYGNPEKITHAKEIIFAALAGLIVILISIMLLGILDPRLLNLTDPEAVVLNSEQGQGAAAENTCADYQSKGYKCITNTECDGGSTVSVSDCTGDNVCCRKKDVKPSWVCEWKCTDLEKCMEKYPDEPLGAKAFTHCTYSTKECEDKIPYIEGNISDMAGAWEMKVTKCIPGEECVYNSTNKKHECKSL